MRPPPFPLLNWRSSQCRRPLPLTSRPRRPGPVYRPVVPPALRQKLASGAPTAKPTKPSGAKEPLPYPTATTTAAGGGWCRGSSAPSLAGRWRWYEVVPTPPASKPVVLQFPSPKPRQSLPHQKRFPPSNFPSLSSASTTLPSPTGPPSHQPLPPLQLYRLLLLHRYHHHHSSSQASSRARDPTFHKPHPTPPPA